MLHQQITDNLFHTQSLHGPFIFSDSKDENLKIKIYKKKIENGKFYTHKQNISSELDCRI